MLLMKMFMLAKLFKSGSWKLSEKCKSDSGSIP